MSGGGVMMDLNINTKISEIVKKYPWIPGELVKMDGKFELLNNPVGKMLLQNATVKDLVGKIGMKPEDAVNMLNNLIASHK